MNNRKKVLANISLNLILEMAQFVVSIYGILGRGITQKDNKICRLC